MFVDSRRSTSCRANWWKVPLPKFHPEHYGDHFNMTNCKQLWWSTLPYKASFVHHHLAGWFATSNITIFALQHILFHPNILFSFFGKLVYSYALVSVWKQFFQRNQRRRLAISPTINNWPLFFLCATSGHAMTSLNYYVQMIIFSIWILFKSFLVNKISRIFPVMHSFALYTMCSIMQLIWFTKFGHQPIPYLVILYLAIITTGIILVNTR